MSVRASLRLAVISRGAESCSAGADAGGLGLVTSGCQPGSFGLVAACRSNGWPIAAAACSGSRRVGSFPAATKSGGGYFYDEVLEYRVWLHPERGAAAYGGLGLFCGIRSL